jgi:hypothetical protein
MSLPAPRTVSRGVAATAAFCLVAPAALNVAFHVLTPATAPDLSTALAQAAAQPGRAATAASLQFALPVLAIGVLVLAWRASAAAPRLAGWGGAFLAGGYLLGTLSVVDNLMQAVVPAHADPAVALAVVQGFEESLPGQLAVLAILGQGPGLILLGLALWRSRAVPRVLAGCFLATLPLHILTHSNDGNTLPALSWGWFTAVLIWCAVVIVRDARGSTAAATAGRWSSRSAAATMSA